MGVCYVVDCHHRGKANGGCRMFRFPPDSEQSTQLRWIALCRRADKPLDKVKPADRICSCHFKDGLKENGPTIFEHSYNKNSKRLATFLSDEDFEALKLEVSKDVQVSKDAKPPPPPQNYKFILPKTDTDETTRATENIQSLLQNKGNETPMPAQNVMFVVPNKHDKKGTDIVLSKIGKKDKIIGKKDKIIAAQNAKFVMKRNVILSKTDYEEEKKREASQNMTLTSIVPSIKKGEEKMKTAKDMSERELRTWIKQIMGKNDKDKVTGSSTDHDYIESEDHCCGKVVKALQDQILHLKRLNNILEREKLELAGKNPRMTLAHIKNDDTKMRFYTSVPYNVFERLLGILQHRCPIKYHSFTVSKMKLEDQLLLTLMKLRLNLRDLDLGFRFDVSQATIANILWTIFPLLHEVLCEGKFLEVPDRVPEVQSGTSQSGPEGFRLLIDGQVCGFLPKGNDHPAKSAGQKRRAEAIESSTSDISGQKKRLETINFTSCDFLSEMISDLPGSSPDIDRGPIPGSSPDIDRGPIPGSAPDIDRGPIQPPETSICTSKTSETISVKSSSGYNSKLQMTPTGFKELESQMDRNMDQENGYIEIPEQSLGSNQETGSSELPLDKTEGLRTSPNDSDTRDPSHKKDTPTTNSNNQNNEIKTIDFRSGVSEMKGELKVVCTTNVNRGPNDVPLVNVVTIMPSKPASQATKALNSLSESLLTPKAMELMKKLRDKEDQLKKIREKKAAEKMEEWRKKEQEKMEESLRKLREREEEEIRKKRKQREIEEELKSLVETGSSNPASRFDRTKIFEILHQTTPLSKYKELQHVISQLCMALANLCPLGKKDSPYRQVTTKSHKRKLSDDQASNYQTF